MSEIDKPQYIFNQRGWPRMEFLDSNQMRCSIQPSSVIYDYEDAFSRPGTSALWIGLHSVKAQVMARHAAAVGVNTSEVTGWVDFPIPYQVLISTRMHLNREQAEWLCKKIKQWLECGDILPGDELIHDGGGI